MKPNNHQGTFGSKSHANILPVDSSVCQPQIDSSSILHRTQAQPQHFYFQQIPQQFYTMQHLSPTEFKKFSPSLNTFCNQKSNSSGKLNPILNRLPSLNPKLLGKPKRTIQLQKTWKRKSTGSKRENDVSTMATGQRDGFSAIMG